MVRHVACFPLKACPSENGLPCVTFFVKLKRAVIQNYGVKIASGDAKIRIKRLSALTLLI